ncbi:hypothetical protein FRC07_002586, partial [Ceratobasidium sp. 392]
MLPELLTTEQVIDKLWTTSALGLPASATEQLVLTGPPEPVVPSSFRIGVVAQAAIACSALSSAYIHQLRHGLDKPQQVSVDARHAVFDCKSEAWATLDGRPVGGTWDKLSGEYKTKDGYVRIHTNFPHLPTSPVPSRETVASSLDHWEAQLFEDAVIQAEGCAFKARSFTEWDAHPHGMHTANLAPLLIRKAGAALARPLPSAKKGDLPLNGLRVLDLTRVIAGPWSVAHGADVIWVTSPNLPNLPALDVDTSRVNVRFSLTLMLKKTCPLFEDCSKTQTSYCNLIPSRPGSLARRGFGPDELAQDYPGLITASLSAFGLDGPWGGRRG